VVTPASGRGVWRRAFPAWQSIPRRVSVIGADAPQPTDVCIVSWGMLDKVVRSIGKRPDLIILDEDHEASNPTPSARSMSTVRRSTTALRC